MKSVLRRFYSRSVCRLQEKRLNNRADHQMTIEIRNVGFINKGAELMLLAILQRVSKEWPDANFAMEPRSKFAPYLERARLGIYKKLPC